MAPSGQHLGLGTLVRPLGCLLHDAQRLRTTAVGPVSGWGDRATWVGGSTWYETGDCSALRPQCIMDALVTSKMTRPAVHALISWACHPKGLSMGCLLAGCLRKSCTRCCFHRTCTLHYPCCGAHASPIPSTCREMMSAGAHQLDGGGGRGSATSSA